VAEVFTRLMNVCFTLTTVQGCGCYRKWQKKNQFLVASLLLSFFSVKKIKNRNVTRYNVFNTGRLNVKLAKSKSLNSAIPIGNAIMAKPKLNPILFFIPVVIDCTRLMAAKKN
jgi:hypothetical protein